MVVGGQTALGDRDEMAHRAANSRSAPQLLGIFNQFRKLMAGQMNGLRQGYEAGSQLKDFDKFLLPATKKHLDALSRTGGGEGGGFKPPPGAIPRQDANGKTWYYTADGKPIPGQ